MVSGSPELNLSHSRCFRALAFAQLSLLPETIWAHCSKLPPYESGYSRDQYLQCASLAGLMKQSDATDDQNRAAELGQTKWLLEHEMVDRSDENIGERNGWERKRDCHLA